MHNLDLQEREREREEIERERERERERRRGHNKDKREVFTATGDYSVASVDCYCGLMVYIAHAYIEYSVCNV